MECAMVKAEEVRLIWIVKQWRVSRSRLSGSVRGGDSSRPA